MPVYTYRGTNRAGGNVTGEMMATNKGELQNLLKRQQITATKMSEKGREINLPTFGSGVNAKELAIFTRQFSVMIDAGLPLVQCLEILASQQENKTFQKVLTNTRHVAISRSFQCRWRASVESKTIGDCFIAAESVVPHMSPT